MSGRRSTTEPTAPTVSEAPARRRTVPRQASWAAAASPAFAAVCTAYLLLRSGVATADLVVYGAFLGIGLLAPGFVLWRLLVSRGSPDLLVDVACGSALACALHLAAYATCSAVGSPGLARWWPVIPLALGASAGPAARVDEV